MSAEHVTEEIKENSPRRESAKAVQRRWGTGLWSRSATEGLCAPHDSRDPQQTQGMMNETPDREIEGFVLAFWFLRE
jgi:hypothetical protein